MANAYVVRRTIVGLLVFGGFFAYLVQRDRRKSGHRAAAEVRQQAPDERRQQLEGNLPKWVRHYAKSPDAEVEVERIWPEKMMFRQGSGNQVRARVLYRIRKPGEDWVRHDAVFQVLQALVDSDEVESEQSRKKNDPDWPT